MAAGTGAAAALHGADALRAVLALTVALCFQIGVNYANDYSDGIRGADVTRLGPARLTASGAARPEAVLIAALTCFGVALAAGTWLVALCRCWWLLVVGGACVPAAWFYTGGRRPYGYRGLGEVYCFIFFGLVAVLGTTYTQAGRLSLAAACAAVGIGALACAVLMANNLRDIATDATVGKRTLAVRLGDRNARRPTRPCLPRPCSWSFPCCPATAGPPWPCFLPVMARPLRAVLAGVQGSVLLPWSATRAGPNWPTACCWPWDWPFPPNGQGSSSLRMHLGATSRASTGSAASRAGGHPSCPEPPAASRAGHLSQRRQPIPAAAACIGMGRKPGFSTGG